MTGSSAVMLVEAEARGVPLIYWRPGCTFCVRLRLLLGTAWRQAVWVREQLGR